MLSLALTFIDEYLDPSSICLSRKRRFPRIVRFPCAPGALSFAAIEVWTCVAYCSSQTRPGRPVSPFRIRDYRNLVQKRRGRENRCLVTSGVSATLVSTNAKLLGKLSSTPVDCRRLLSGGYRSGRNVTRGTRFAVCDDHDSGGRCITPEQCFSIWPVASSQ
jgi:hypothetical protein